MNNKGFYVGCQVKILGTDTAFLKDSIGKIGTVVDINEMYENCLVKFSRNYSDDNQWFYSWKELEMIE